MDVLFKHVWDWEHQARLSRFSSQKLAANLGVSQRHLQRHFKICRIRLQSWLNEVRLHDARHLLDGKKSVKEVAYLLYYKQQSHFTRHFKGRFGISPDKFSRLNFVRNPQFKDLYEKLHSPNEPSLKNVAFR